LAKLIEDQADTIKRQAEQIRRLSLLLLQHHDVSEAEIETVTGERENNAPE